LFGSGLRSAPRERGLLPRPRIARFGPVTVCADRVDPPDRTLFGFQRPNEARGACSELLEHSDCWAWTEMGPSTRAENEFTKQFRGRQGAVAIAEPLGDGRPASFLQRSRAS
jgi:hypothetical protein